MADAFLCSAASTLLAQTPCAVFRCVDQRPCHRSLKRRERRANAREISAVSGPIWTKRLLETLKQMPQQRINAETGLTLATRRRQQMVARSVGSREQSCLLEPHQTQDRVSEGPGSCRSWPNKARAGKHGTWFGPSPPSDDRLRTQVCTDAHLGCFHLY